MYLLSNKDLRAGGGKAHRQRDLCLIIPFPNFTYFIFQEEEIKTLQIFCSSVTLSWVILKLTSKLNLFFLSLNEENYIITAFNNMFVIIGLIENSPAHSVVWCEGTTEAVPLLR